MCAGEPSGFPRAFNKGWIPNFLQKFGILSSLSKILFRQAGAGSLTPPTSLRDCLGSLVLDGLRSPCHCEGEARRGNPFPHASPAADCAVGEVAERQRGRRGWAYMHTGTPGTAFPTIEKRPFPITEAVVFLCCKIPCRGDHCVKRNIGNT